MIIPNWFARRNIFYGWIIVFVCFVSIFTVFGIRLSFGIFFDVLTRENSQFNWTRAQTASVFSTTMIVFALFSTVSGWAFDRFGPRPVFITGTTMVGTGLILTSRMTGLFEFFLYYGIWTGIGITILGLAIQAAAISQWFSYLGRRGLAIGIAFSGTGAGILFMAPLVERIVTIYDWRMAFLVLAGLMLGINIPILLLFMRDRPRDIGLLPDGIKSDLSPGPLIDASSESSNHSIARSWTFVQATKTGIFWMLMFAGAGSLFSLRMITVHQVAHLVDQGFTRLTAATVMGSTGLITAGAFVLFGQLSDRIGRGRAFYVGAVAQAAALILLIYLNAGLPRFFLYTYAFLWGVGEGSRSGLLTAIASDKFPGSAQGTIIGALGAFFGVGAAFGSWLGGYVFDEWGQYDLAFWLAFTATVAATIAIFFVERRSNNTTTV